MYVMIFFNDESNENAIVFVIVRTYILLHLLTGHTLRPYIDEEVDSILPFCPEICRITLAPFKN